MNPQKLSQLDPKLREAYQRVMQTPVSASQTPPTPIQNPPPPVQTSQIQDTTHSISASEPTHSLDLNPLGLKSEEANSQLNTLSQDPTLNQTQPAAQSFTSINQPQTISSADPVMPNFPQSTGFDQMHSEIAPASFSSNAKSHVPQAQIIPAKKGKKFTPFLIGFGALILIFTYTFLWIKIFNFKLPFLP